MSHTERRTGPAPLVSCPLPTCHRRAFVSQSISYFLRPDNPRKELINRDDVEESVAGALSLGAKFNRGCDEGSGELIARGYEHAWIGADRFRVQVWSLDLDLKEVPGRGII